MTGFAPASPPPLFGRNFRYVATPTTPAAVAATTPFRILCDFLGEGWRSFIITSCFPIRSVSQPTSSFLCVFMDMGRLYPSWRVHETVTPGRGIPSDTDSDYCQAVVGAGGTLSPLGERRFRLFWLGRVTSAAGDALVPVALSFAVLSINHSGLALGGVLAAFTGSRVVF